MKSPGTYKDLLMLRNDIQKQSSESAAFKYFNERKIEDFFKLNKMMLDVIIDKLNYLTKKYVKYDENFKPIVLESKGADLKKYDFYDENAEINFNKEYNELMNRHCTIHY